MEKNTSLSSVKQMLDIYIIYDEHSPEKLITESDVPNIGFYHFLDIGSKLSRSKAFKLKGSYGARENPFAVVLQKDVPLKAFYAEADDVINDLIKFLKDYASKNCKENQ